MKFSTRIISIFFLSIIGGFFLSCDSEDKDNPSGSTPDNPTATIPIPDQGFVSPTTYDGMTLVWEDDFEGNSLDIANWSHETGTGNNGWGNNELQYYRSQNTSVERGHLIITAKQESFGGSQYTSSRIVSMNKKQFRYGRVDIRAVMPRGQGLWPALWMLGSNFSEVGWPACGEIDIMEMVGGQGRENTVHGTVHWQNDGSHAEFGRSYRLPSGTLADKFHVFSIVWDATSIRWYIDNVEYNVIDTTPAQLDEFRRSFFFIMNVAVGGNWPGSPDNTTVFPQHMIVDYIRVFQFD
ncbi:glycoside hydrolase family 16 protein [Algoriphagus kandeliae]|uniref:Glycoside hydrolase family 16 protein n=1 Tax=Algoriphagus kandeliae TaxID=2562278 RepID=A0A4Y9QQN9_9BACT|nr:glycoside hydrolase family 16 protein [Algoriphagus kandeliae]TFV93346.1 glycoside hydrolase family 16 protein [Algoriphagus kandeliae]